VIAGRAHPQDDAAKRTVQEIFAMNDLPGVGGHGVFLEEHDMSLASELVQGCDLWINLPRPPQEASGTSGMKSAVNGGLHLSVLDGWWAEAFDGTNGWGVESDPNRAQEEQDRQDSGRVFDLLEFEVIPLFYERGADDIPHAWLRKVKASLRSIGPRFNAGRMLEDYLRQAEAPGARKSGGTPP
jgi:starch phosphorylase